MCNCAMASQIAPCLSKEHYQCLKDCTDTSDTTDARTYKAALILKYLQF